MLGAQLGGMAGQLGQQYIPFSAAPQFGCFSPPVYAPMQPGAGSQLYRGWGTA
jgi:hypothetical protein